jgi:2-dehydropantoate 2-reductase
VKIAVVGAGGVGGYFGGRLAAAGADVTFLARGSHYGALRDRGLQIKSAAGDLSLQVKIANHPSAVGVADWVWIAVKLWDTEDAAISARPMIGPSTTVVSFQNGVEKEDVLRRALPEAHLIGGVSYIAAMISEPGVIAHTGTLARLQFGEFDGRRTGKVTALLSACREAGIDAEVPDDIRLAVWSKFVLLVGLSGMTSATRLPIGEVRREPLTREMLHDAVREASAVGRAMGVRLDESFVEERLAMFDQWPAEMTSSMHQDLKKGNRLELEWLSGAVVRLGEAHGVPTPCNRAIRAVLAPYREGRTA